MGAQEEFDERHFNKSDAEIKNMKQEAEEIIESYKSLKTKTDAQHRTIVGLNSDKEDAKTRVRALINRRIAGEGPDYDAYQIHRRISKQYDPTAALKSSSLKRTTEAPPVVDDQNENDEVEPVDNAESEA